MEEYNFILNLIMTIPFTIVGVWAIVKYVKMNEKVKNAIIEEKRGRK